MGRTKKEREELKEQICNLAVLGYSYMTIAKQIDISPRQVQRYLTERREARAAEQHNKADEIIGELIESQEKRMKYLFGILAEGTKNEKMKALGLMQTEEQMKIKRHQLAGNLPTDGPNVSINNTNVVEGVTTVADSIRRIYPEMVNKFVKNKARLINEKKQSEREEDPKSNQIEYSGEAKTD